ncbi:MAG: glycoside hydrolase family 130 protein [Ignavibacteriaceae bacterium]
MFVSRLTKQIKPDPGRVILQFFNVGNEQRILDVINRVLALPEQEVVILLESVMRDFSTRHNDFNRKVIENYKRIEKYVVKDISTGRKLLLGAYFSKEYSIEAASLFNPSIVAHPDQSFLKPGILRFIISLRATGEGHISSLEFRSGIIDENGEIYLDETSRFCDQPAVNENKNINKDLLSKNIHSRNDAEENIINKMPDSFTYKQVKKILDEELKTCGGEDIKSFIGKILNFSEANYEISFDASTQVSERIIFPYSNNESVGIEDARFVKFIDDDGSAFYYATYTAYNGKNISTQLIKTEDFLNFSISTMQGHAVQDKGMALFPRKVNGKYVISSRQGGENLQIMLSDDLYNWEEYRQHRIPAEPWEFVQLGNCGSPIETKEGWLLLTHAVGPFRKYSIGALLLDLNDPVKIIGRLKSPLIETFKNEREGYVPNVVYSCGSIVHNNELIIPYAMSDSISGFAKISLPGLLAELKENN